MPATLTLPRTFQIPSGLGDRAITAPPAWPTLPLFINKVNPFTFFISLFKCHPSNEDYSAHPLVLNLILPFFLGISNLPYPLLCELITTSLPQPVPSQVLYNLLFQKFTFYFLFFMQESLWFVHIYIPGGWNRDWHKWTSVNMGWMSKWMSY